MASVSNRQKRPSSAKGFAGSSKMLAVSRKKVTGLAWKTSLSSMSKDVESLLAKCSKISPPPPVSLQILMANSEAFPIKFPVDAPRCSELRKRTSERVLEDHANSVYPIIHEAMLPLIADWLDHKVKNGSSTERELFRNMGLIELVQRLLERRAICFLGRKDKYRIFEKRLGFGGWEEVGTPSEKPPLTLEKYLSYDEIKLAAMLTMSSYTEFINDGSRKNKGVVATEPDTIEPRGVILGVVGSRFQKPGFMEYEDIAVDVDQNVTKNGYGPSADESNPLRGLRQVWARFYGNAYSPLHEEVERRLRQNPDDPRYVRVARKYIFDSENYIKRTLITAEIILLEANARALEKKTTAYIHVVGFGLGVWKALPEQELYFMEAFDIAINGSLPNITNVSDIMFSYMRRETSCGGVRNGGNIGHIKIHFGNREPHSRLDDGGGKLLIVTYAWDGNALPGNEFWMGKLTSSGDPAAACSTQIAELHNFHINPRASAASLRVASPEHGILHVADYAKMKMGSEK